MKCEDCGINTYIIHISQSYKKLCSECYYKEEEKPKKYPFIGRHDRD